MIIMHCDCQKCKRHFDKYLPDRYKKKLDQEKYCVFCESKDIKIEYEMPSR